MSPALPFVLVNMAMTADGKIATPNRAVSSFGSRRDFAHLLDLRATADAVMCGARTVDSEPINLGPGPAKYRHRRLRNGLAEYNLRVIASGSGTVDPNAEIFCHRFSPIIILTTRSASERTRRRLGGLADEIKIVGRSEIDFRQALAWLREKWNVRRLLCEGGGELNSALFRAGLVNELHVTICPKLLGGRLAPTIADGIGFPRLSEAAQLRLKSTKRVGDELFLGCRVLSNPQHGPDPADHTD
ncbi:MAG: dihydrofolate reductase family protein [Verrucomicrobia bacterium]|nr:dihydrofolate reductase family protein [Verrucomicrobiota bacterium]